MVGDASSGAANTNTAGEGPSGGAEWWDCDYIWLSTLENENVERRGIMKR